MLSTFWTTGSWSENERRKWYCNQDLENLAAHPHQEFLGLPPGEICCPGIRGGGGRERILCQGVDERAFQTSLNLFRLAKITMLCFRAKCWNLISKTLFCTRSYCKNCHNFVLQDGETIKKNIPCLMARPCVGQVIISKRPGVSVEFF